MTLRPSFLFTWLAAALLPFAGQAQAQIEFDGVRLASLGGDFVSTGQPYADFATDGTWAFFNSTSANGGPLTPVGPFSSIGNAGNSGYGGALNTYNLGAVANTIIFVDGGLNGTLGEDELAIHPSGNGINPAGRPFFIARWTAGPLSAGEIRIAGSYRNRVGGSNTVNFAIYVNGANRFARTNADASFDITATIAAGQTVTFVVGSGGDIFADETFAGAVIYRPLPPPDPIILGHPVISEFMASNGSSAEDEDGDASDWIEIHNTTASALDLENWALTDDPLKPAKWRFPSVTVEPNQHLLVFASEKDRAIAGSPLHTNFKLAVDGEYLALANPAGTVVSSYTPVYPRQVEDISYGREGAAQTEGYMTRPSPRALNKPVHSGPVVAAVQHAPAQPSATDPVTVTAEIVTPPGEAVASVALAYRAMFEAEQSVPMRDDGTAPDATAADGIYTANIPAGTAAAGRMLRWKVTATGTLGSTFKLPAFARRSGEDQSAEYFGTVIRDPAITSQLPVFHWYVKPGSETAATTYAGTRCSLYYDGAFYDNIFVRRRGDTSSSGYPKANFKFDFNKGENFRLAADQRRVSEFNINSAWSDKAFIRRALAFETYAAAGSPYGIAFPMRLQQNGAFYSVATYEEQPEPDYLIRQGMDPEGAVYKMVSSQLEAVGASEKKTRRTENMADLQALITGIAPSNANRTNYVWDNVDLPRMFNYLAASVLIHENDHMSKNYYTYRDTNGTGEWCMLPWDKDLTYGKNWDPNTGGVLSDTIWADNDSIGGSSIVKPSHPLFGDSAHQKNDLLWNRLFDAIYKDPVLRGMYLRRLRSVMDLWLQPESTPLAGRVIEKRIDRMVALMAPDVTLDKAKWGNSYGTSQTFTQAVDIIRNNYLPRRRKHLYENHALGSTYAGTAGIPPAQTNSPPITFGTIESNPASGNQDEEFIQLNNPNTVAVDVSGWRLTGGIEQTFRPGTVIPPNGSLYASPGSSAFRARTVSPKRGERCLVQSPYSGHLNNFGEQLQLLDAAGTVIATATSPANPSDPQKYLVISEIMYHPEPDGAAEYIELLNISPAVTLDLSGVKFTAGIEFTFPDGFTLAPGARTLVIENTASFEAAYGTGKPVAGLFANGSSLDNSSERVKLDDHTGSTIREFVYNDKLPWPPEADTGSALVLISPYSTPDPGSPYNWRVAPLPNPGSASGTLTFAAWKATHQQSDDNDDPDRDGLSIFAEYALGGDPALSSQASLPQMTRQPDGTAIFKFSRPLTADDAAWEIEAGSDLSGWSAAPATLVSRASAAGTETFGFSIAADAFTPARRFWRLRLWLR